MIDKLQSFYGFARMPFGRDLAPGMLHRHTSHAEAVARITWCVTERRIGVVTGEVGPGPHCVFLPELSRPVQTGAGLCCGC